MKTLLIMVFILSIAIPALAKDYTVTLDDKLVPYFEKIVMGEEEMTPEEWLTSQAEKKADEAINYEYRNKILKKISRDKKIADIKKEKINK